MKTDTLSRDRNLSIDALRGIAALSVLFYHSSIPPFPAEKFGLFWYDQWVLFFGGYGRWGVDLFFILSGYCIHWASTKPGSRLIARNYLIRRWWRIYPPYFFAVGFSVFLNLATCHYKWQTQTGVLSWANFGAFQIGTHVFLVHNLFSESLATVSGPFWTIAVEAQYYLLYLAVLPALKHAQGRWLVGAVAVLLAAGAFVLSDRLQGFQPWQPFLYWPQWILGAGLAQLVRGKPTVLKGWPFFAALFAAAMLLYAQFSWEHFWGPHLQFYILTFGIAFLVLFFLRFGTVWSWPPLRWVPAVGLFSYSLYLVHFPIMDRIRTFIIPELASGWLRVTASLVSLGISVGAAYLFFLLFEKPFLERSTRVVTHQIQNEKASAYA